MKTLMTSIVIFFLVCSYSMADTGFGISEVGTLSSITSIDSGLVAYYPFNGNANDESAMGNNGTVGGAILTDDRFGNPSSAYYFDGVDDRIEVADDPSLRPSNISIAVWIKPLSLAPYTCLIMKTSISSWNDGYALAHYDGSNDMNFFINNYSNNYARGTATLDDWQFIVGVYDKSWIKIYINGQVIDSTASTNDIVHSLNSLTFGNTSYAGENFPFHGSMDDIRIYNRSLSNQEILYLYSEEEQEGTAPLLSWTPEPGYESDGVNPDTALTSGTFTFRITYSDADGDAPEMGYPRLHLLKNSIAIAGSPFNMAEANMDPFETGRIYTVNIDGLEWGEDYTYYFEAQDTTGMTATGDPISEQTGPVVQVDFNDGLVAYYPFNGNANDESGNGIHGTVVNATLVGDRRGNLNSGAYSFDGDGDYIEADATNLPTAERTISVWFYSNSVLSRPGILGYGGSGSGGTSLFMCLNHQGDPVYHMSCHYEVNILEYNYTEEPVGRWYQWVITINSAGTSFYINGQPVISNSNFVNNTYVENRELGIGVISSVNGVVPYTDSSVGYFNGILDDIRIYNRALSSEEILTLYNIESPSSTLSDTLICGNPIVGNSTINDYTIINSGTETLNISVSSIEGTDAGEFSILSGGGPLTIAPGGSDYVTIQFTPDSTGYKNALLIIESDAATSPDSVLLTGLGKTSVAGETWLVYAARENATDSLDIFRMKPDGTQLTNLSNWPDDKDQFPRISPDGKTVLWTTDRYGDLELVTKDVDGLNLQVLTNNSADDMNGAWSPDGSRIAFFSDLNDPGQPPEIYIMNSDGSNIQQITSGLEPQSNSTLDWSVFGIIFTRLIGSETHIFRVNSDGSGLTNLTTGLGGSPNYSRWSPDGMEITYSAVSVTNAIYTMDFDGNSKILVYNSDYSDMAPVWDPWGRDSLAFLSKVSSPADPWEMHIINREGSGLRQVTFDQEPGRPFDYAILDAELLGPFVKITEDDIVADGGHFYGASWGDYDNDSDQDVIVVNNDLYNFLYENNGDGTFTKITSGDIISDEGHSTAATWGDYDNDGLLDLFITNRINEVNFLYHNEGSGVFTKITTGEIVNDIGSSWGASWGDYDNDGYLDLFVANEGNDFLYNNNRDGTFTKITTGDIVNDGDDTYSPAWGDYNNDGYIDLFLPCGGNDFLYKNNGDGTFEKIVTGDIVNNPALKRGASWGDYNNDGYLDLFVATLVKNCLYMNNGDETFTKITAGAIVNDDYNSSASSWGDYDNDGDLDLYVGAYLTKNNFIYENDGSGNFTKIVSGNLAADQHNVTGATWADYDKDGDLDLFTSVNHTTYYINDYNSLYQNAGNENNWINIKCVGTTSNTSAIGAKVQIKATINALPVWQLRQISGLTGFGSQNSLNAEFGLGDATLVDSLVVKWPSGTEQVLTNVSANQFLTIAEELPERIDNSIVYAHFDHAHGMIDTLIFRAGSNNELLDQAWNTSNQRGLGRLGALDDGSTQISKLDFGTDSASVTYTNPNYGSKTFKMRWSSGIGFEMDMLFDITVAELEGSTWQPGGDNDGNDTVKVIKANFSTEVIPYNYPGGHQTLFYDLSYGVGVWDGDYDEVYGYAFKDLHYLSISNGTSADGPFPHLTAGQDTIYFAVKNEADFWNWISAVSGTESIDFTHTLTVTDFNNETIDLHFGTDPTGSDGYDSGLDLYAPPVPPAGSFDARFGIGGEDFIDDIRATNSGSITWEVRYQPSANGDPVMLTWDNTTLPPGKFALIDAPTNGDLVNIDMKSENGFSDDLGIYNLYILYTLSEAYSQQVAWGWNMIGLPYNPDDSYYLSLYPSAMSGTLYKFDATYVNEDSLEVGNGYWLRFENPQTFQLEGYPINSLTLDLDLDWNMISGISGDVPLANISDPGGIIIPGTLFGFEGVYVARDTIDQGKGYWLRTIAAGQVSMDIGSAVLPKPAFFSEDLSIFSSLSICDNAGFSQKLYFDVKLPEAINRLSYSLPPLPPDESFDVRFAGDTRISESDEAVILIQASEYPLTITIEQLNMDEHFGYVLDEMNGKEVTESYEIHVGQSIQIIDAAVTSMKLRKIEIIPETFIVYQNYPNPFNPTTEIKYGIPADDDVEVTIYNALGQCVKSLVKQHQKAGYHQVSWDGTNSISQKVSTGIYFYRIKAGKHMDIKKMVLIK